MDNTYMAFQVMRKVFAKAFMESNIPQGTDADKVGNAILEALKAAEDAAKVE